MREIKFRGKDCWENWRYGDLMKNSIPTASPVIVEDFYYDDPDDSMFEVNPDTVGQFTGLLDVEGREIYEGDVIQIVTKNPYWAFKKNYAVYWDLDGFCLEGEPLYYWFKLHDLKVIGNVHDNPELLEATHD